MASHLSESLSSINQQTSVEESVEKREPSCTVDGNADWGSHCGKQYGVSSKIKYGTVLWPRDSTSGNMSEETQNTGLKEYTHPQVYCSAIYNSQKLEATKVPTSRWVDKKTVVHLHSGILHSYRKITSYPLWQYEWTWRMLCKVK